LTFLILVIGLYLGLWCYSTVMYVLLPGLYYNIWLSWYCIRRWIIPEAVFRWFLGNPQEAGRFWPENARNPVTGSVQRNTASMKSLEYHGMGRFRAGLFDLGFKSYWLFLSFFVLKMTMLTNLFPIVNVENSTGFVEISLRLNTHPLSLHISLFKSDILLFHSKI
jgi:hypothetical protein